MTAGFPVNNGIPAVISLSPVTYLRSADRSSICAGFFSSVFPYPFNEETCSYANRRRAQWKVLMRRTRRGRNAEALLKYDRRILVFSNMDFTQADTGGVQICQKSV